MGKIGLFTYGDIGYLIDNKPILELKLDIAKDEEIDTNGYSNEYIKKHIFIGFNEYLKLVREIDSIAKEIKENIINYKKDIESINEKYRYLEHISINTNIDIKYQRLSCIPTFTLYIAYHSLYKLVYPSEYEETMNNLKMIYKELSSVDERYKSWYGLIITPDNIETVGNNKIGSKFDRCTYQLKKILNYI